ncbi:MAG: hemolysin III family protein [Balneolaceae bacterium]|nr:hemolysin III family protein [Balneolaceae bacterium]
MRIFQEKNHSEQTRKEEIANAISHGVGALAAIVAAPFLIYYTVNHGDPLSVAGVSVFIASAILLYLSSTLFHLLQNKKAKNVFQIFDHVAIFILIAGTYTPFTVGILHGPFGWFMLALIWFVAIIGIILRLWLGKSNMKIYVVFYLLMGWMIFIGIKPLIENMELAGLLWLAVGGAAYTLGIIFYLLPHRTYSHFVWHLFVLAGTSTHFMAVMYYSF